MNESVCRRRSCIVAHAAASVFRRGCVAGHAAAAAAPLGEEAV